MTVGNLLEILTIGLGGLFFIWELRSRLAILQFSNDNTAKHLERLDVDFRELAKVTVTIATQNERLNSFEARMAEISHNLKMTMETQERRMKSNDELREQMFGRFDNLSGTISNDSKEYYAALDELKERVNNIANEVHSVSSQKTKRRA